MNLIVSLTFDGCSHSTTCDDTKTVFKHLCGVDLGIQHLKYWLDDVGCFNYATADMIDYDSDESQSFIHDSHD